MLMLHILSLQAMMDLGSGVCTPGQPACDRCPVRDYCLAGARDQAELFPVKSAKKARRVEQKTVLVVIEEDRLFLRKRAETGLLAGLWEFPSLDGDADERQVRQALELVGIPVRRLIPLAHSKHLFTHIEWHMSGFAAAVSERREADGCIWAEHAQLKQRYPLPSAFRPFLQTAETELLRAAENNPG